MHKTTTVAICPLCRRTMDPGLGWCRSCDRLDGQTFEQAWPDTQAIRCAQAAEIAARYDRKIDRLLDALIVAKRAHADRPCDATLRTRQDAQAAYDHARDMGRLAGRIVAWYRTGALFYNLNDLRKGARA